MSRECTCPTTPRRYDDPPLMPDEDCPMHEDPCVIGQPQDDTRREDEPGDWFVADFDGECSRDGEKFGASVTIRADGDGGWECQECVDEDEFKAEQWDIYVESTEMLGGAA
jgi:hypothetical protein